jgi:hypothetical protein
MACQLRIVGVERQQELLGQDHRRLHRMLELAADRILVLASGPEFFFSSLDSITSEFWQPYAVVVANKIQSVESTRTVTEGTRVK